ncbi:oxidoreductase [Hyaloraphidium curvatum]|nr:oxidoreductase [Hyaloraphidium curvatum]
MTNEVVVVPVGENKTKLPEIEVGKRLVSRRFPGTKKVVLVTGGASGIGARFSLRAAAEGADVVIADLPAQAEAAAQVIKSISALGNGSKAIFVELDVTKEDQWNAAIAKTEAELGPLSVLINGAGVTGTSQPLEDLDMASFAKCNAINVDGVMLGCKYGTRSMLKLPKEADKSIINISSILGIVGSKNAFAYGASKGAVRTLTKTVAMHLADRGTGIRCTSVHPGFIESQMTDSWLNDPQVYQQIAKEHALNRFGTADEVSNILLFLASEESSFCTGGEYLVDGGYVAH